MTPAEIEAKADEIRAALQGLAAKKIGFGMDNTFRQILKAAFDAMGLVRELARLVDKPSPDQPKE